MRILLVGKEGVTMNLSKAGESVDARENTTMIL